MKPAARLLGPLLVALGLAACAASTQDRGGVTNAQPATDEMGACRAGGAACRWDRQCCSGRCYVDTGCSG
ncbi:MAG TPA: hypothetical protein VGG39_13585 [Polyangiaceae bacterium]|jgi:hypothetical protein